VKQRLIIGGACRRIYGARKGIKVKKCMIEMIPEANAQYSEQKILIGKPWMMLLDILYHTNSGNGCTGISKF
jgi:hypothetical protein